jgi:hypothetical protein
MAIASLDSSWYHAVNEFARDTGWAHGPLANYANWAGLVLLALLLVAGWLLGRRLPEAYRQTATAFLVGTSAVLALLANQAIGTVRLGRGCGLRSGCVGRPSLPFGCNSFASWPWRAEWRARSV